LTLEDNPINGLVSPPLSGSTGIVPLSIISVIPDIIEVTHGVKTNLLGSILMTVAPRRSHRSGGV
jgi:hypothetical protein